MRFVADCFLCFLGVQLPRCCFVLFLAFLFVLFLFQEFAYCFHSLCLCFGWLFGFGSHPSLCILRLSGFRRIFCIEVRYSVEFALYQNHRRRECSLWLALLFTNCKKHTNARLEIYFYNTFIVSSTL